MKSKITIAILSASLVSACTSSDLAPNSDDRPVPVDAIINQMKCEIALAMTTMDSDKLDFSGWYIDGKLTAKTITTDTSSANIKTDTLVPLNSRVSAGFSLGSDITISRTLDQVSDFVISPYADNADICKRQRAPTVRAVTGLGIHNWLQKLTSPAAGDPKITWTSLSYTLDFGVKRTGKGGFDVAVIGIKASASANVSRDDINQLVLKFSPGEEAIKKYKNEVRHGVGRRKTVEAPVFKPFGGSTDVLLDNDETLTQMLSKRVLVPE